VNVFMNRSRSINYMFITLLFIFTIWMEIFKNLSFHNFSQNIFFLEIYFLIVAMVPTTGIYRSLFRYIYMI
jgi:phage gp29-like protein